MLGDSQRNVTRLLTETVPEIAARRPFTVVLIDEVESFAVRRSAASFEANPVDVHRAVQWPALLPLAQDAARMSELAALCEGWDGRRIRKLVLAGLAQRLEVARDPAGLTWDDLLSAARKKGGVEWAGGRAPTSRELFPDVPKDLMHDHDHGHGPHDHGHGPHTHTHHADAEPRSHS
jgi:hypothetical protein